MDWGCMIISIISLEILQSSVILLPSNEISICLRFILFDPYKDNIIIETSLDSESTIGLIK